MAIVIGDAPAILRAGGVVGMPTETVYGLAADARDVAAVRRVFELKGRPATNPLIVHVASVEVADRYAVVDERALALFAAFAPGPLTVVLSRRANARGWRSMVASDAPVCDLVTAGLDTVGIRIPAHPLALELLRAFDGPIAAPSANQSNHVSPTTAQHVREEFGDAVPVLDGGPCAVGVESTVLSLVGERPRLLRPGAVTRAQIESVIGPVERFVGHVAPSVAAASPGQHATHYAPRSPAFRFSAGDPMPDVAGRRAAAIVLCALPSAWRAEAFADVRALGDAEAAAARSLYATLREVDAASPEAIFVEMPPDAPEWTALRDRITRATRPFPF